MVSLVLLFSPSPTLLEIWPFALNQFGLHDLSLTWGESTKNVVARMSQRISVPSELNVVERRGHTLQQDNKITGRDQMLAKVPGNDGNSHPFTERHARTAGRRRLRPWRRDRRRLPWSCWAHWSKALRRKTVVEGLRVNSFTDAEEEAVGLATIVPSPDEALRARHEVRGRVELFFHVGHERAVICSLRVAHDLHAIPLNSWKSYRR